MNPPELQFAETQPPSPAVIGWRHEGVLRAEARSVIAPYIDHRDESARYFTPKRSVIVPPFRIATRTFHWESLCEWDEDTISSIDTLAEFCDRIEHDLEQFGWRLPTESDNGVPDSEFSRLTGEVGG